MLRENINAAFAHALLLETLLALLRTYRIRVLCCASTSKRCCSCLLLLLIALECVNFRLFAHDDELVRAAANTTAVLCYLLPRLRCSNITLLHGLRELACWLLASNFCCIVVHLRQLKREQLQLCSCEHARAYCFELTSNVFAPLLALDSFASCHVLRTDKCCCLLASCCTRLTSRTD